MSVVAAMSRCRSPLVSKRVRAWQLAWQDLRMKRVSVPVCEESTLTRSGSAGAARLQVSWKGLELLEYSVARYVRPQYSPRSWFFWMGWLDLRRVTGVVLAAGGLIRRRQSRSMRWEREPRLLAWWRWQASRGDWCAAWSAVGDSAAWRREDTVDLLLVLAAEDEGSVDVDVEFEESSKTSLGFRIVQKRIRCRSSRI